MHSFCFNIAICNNLSKSFLLLQIFVEDVMDHSPILGFATNDINRDSVIYPTTLGSDKFYEYNINKPIYFLNDTYLRDDRGIQDIFIEIITTVPTTDQILWNDTLQHELGIEFTDRSSRLETLYTFSANISAQLGWEMFLMSFSFLQNEERAANRNTGNRTVNITVHDSSNIVTITVVIDVLPLPPVVLITVQDITFTEGENFIWLKNLEFPIAIIQDEDALFISLRITLR